jgi:prepilin-type processing-associated H-X9-DG protein
LVENTLARIEANNFVTAGTSDQVELGGEFDRPVASCLTVAVETSNNGRRWMDSAALTVSMTVLCCLTIPAIVRARFESRRAQCADNLRQTGQSLLEYAIRRPDRRYPFVASSGPEAFSGVFVIRLNDAGLLPAGRLLPCASLYGVDRPSIASNVVLPTLEELCSAENSQRECIKKTVGGDYAYNLGVFEDGVLVAPRNTGNSHFAIMTDAPFLVDNTDRIIAHDGRGINILYDDGHVRFVTSQWILSGEAGDDPFRNMRGAREAGVSRLDASLAPSQFPPISLTISH